MNAYRKLAITQMAQIFQKATKTLILTTDLEATSIHVPREELVMRITSNSWWRRLWTLQEAVLTQNMIFRCHDGYIDARELTDQFEPTSEENSFEISTQLFLEGIEPLRRLDSMRKHPPKERVNDLWDTVMWRSTSKLKDEAICLATIMGLSTEDIVQAADEEKLKKFIILQQRFRADFIFRLGPRMKQDGYGWAPLTFVMNFMPDQNLTPSPAPLAFAR